MLRTYIEEPGQALRLTGSVVAPGVSVSVVVVVSSLSVLVLAFN